MRLLSPALAFILQRRSLWTRRILIEDNLIASITVTTLNDADLAALNSIVGTVKIK